MLYLFIFILFLFYIFYFVFVSISPKKKKKRVRWFREAHERSLGIPVHELDVKTTPNVIQCMRQNIRQNAFLTVARAEICDVTKFLHAQCNRNTRDQAPQNVILMCARMYYVVFYAYAQLPAGQLNANRL